MKGSFKTAKKITGLQALYLHYCYLLGVIPKSKRHTPLSPEMKEACRWLDRYSEQVRLVDKYKLHDLPSVNDFIEKNNTEMKLLTDYRRIIRKELASCHDPDRVQVLITKQNDCTAALAELRKEIKTAERILDDNPKIKENIRIEEQMRQEMRDNAKLERVQNIPLNELHPFKNHPFKIINNEEMQQMIESIRKVGVITPALARPLPDGGYDLISGHRRLAACQVLGVETMPVIVREMSDDEAVIAMVDANLQRDHILPSEKAFAYKMKRDALNHQGIASPQVGEKLLTAEKIGADSGDSRNQVLRYIRLTYLIPELLEMVDDGKIAFNPAVEISYLEHAEQRVLLDE